MMSSATSIDPSGAADGLRPGTDAAGGPANSRKTAAGRVAKGTGKGASQPEVAGETDPGLRPWQFFVLAGMLSATAVVIVATGQSPAAIIVLSLTVLSASLVALGTYRALAPLATREAIEPPQMLGGRTRAALEREKTLVLRSIKDLEFDFAMKKMSQSDYDEMAARLRARAVGLLRQLDEHGGYRATIETELSKRLGKRGGASAATTSAAPVTIDRDEPAAGVTAAACGACGQANDTDARFCKHCGGRMTA
jgi:hypothetical protein